MTSERIYKLTLCAGLIAVSIYALITVQQYVDPLAGRYARTLDTTFMPTVWAYVLLILSLLYGAQVLFFEQPKQQRQQPPAEEAARAGKVLLLRIAGTIVLVLAYALLLRNVHFIPLTSAFLFLTLLLYGQHNLLKTLAAAVLGGVGFYLIFVFALRIPL